MPGCDLVFPRFHLKYSVSSHVCYTRIFLNRNFPSCIGEDAFEWVGDRNKPPHSLPDVTSSNTRYTCEDDPSIAKPALPVKRLERLTNNRLVRGSNPFGGLWLTPAIKDSSDRCRKTYPFSSAGKGIGLRIVKSGVRISSEVFSADTCAKD